METNRWLRNARKLAFVCLCFDLGCSTSGNQGSDAEVIAPGTGGTTAFGTGGMAATGAPGSGGIGGSGGIASGAGGANAMSGGADASGTGGVSGSGGISGAGGTNAMSGGAGASGAGGASEGSGGAGTMDSGAGDAADAAAKYNPCPDNGDPCKILPLGDSITFGIQLPGAYRIELFRQAVEAKQNIVFVGSQMNGPAMVDGVAFPQNHEGYSGYTIAQIDNPILAPALMFDPDIITLMIGTNDMYGADPAGAPDRLGHLLDDIFSMNTHALLVVAQLTPLSCCMSMVDDYNKAIPGIVQAHAAAGKHVIMVDMSATMISSDSVHPNEAGYTHMGQVWYAAISDLLPKKK